jgi:hypothetical protein
VVYVDNQRNRYRGMRMSHMVADGLAELHAMADALGVDRRHFQNKRIPHYDICQSKRAHAVRLGAAEVTARDIVRLHRRRSGSAK